MHAACCPRDATAGSISCGCTLPDRPHALSPYRWATPSSPGRPGACGSPPRGRPANWRPPPGTPPSLPQPCTGTSSRAAAAAATSPRATVRDAVVALAAPARAPALHAPLAAQGVRSCLAVRRGAQALLLPLPTACRRPCRLPCHITGFPPNAQAAAVTSATPQPQSWAWTRVRQSFTTGRQTTATRRGCARCGGAWGGEATSRGGAAQLQGGDCSCQRVAAAGRRDSMCSVHCCACRQGQAFRARADAPPSPTPPLWPQVAALGRHPVVSAVLHHAVYRLPAA
jgi:hypothetical protein